MFSVILAKVKVWWKLVVGAVVVMVPVIAYLFGRKEGSASEKVDYLQDNIKNEQNKADFYSNMGDAVHEANTSRPINRDAMVERLRKHGL